MEITNIDSFFEYYQSIRGRTQRVIKCIPPDKIDWTYLPSKFTFADLIRHLAAVERFVFAEGVRGNKSAYPGHEKDLADGYDNVMQFFEQMHAESTEIFRSLTNDDLQRTVYTPSDTPIPVWQLLRAAAEHEIHHRGQIYTYLGILQIPVPPLYGLTSEEVREKSRQR